MSSRDERSPGICQAGSTKEWDESAESPFQITPFHIDLTSNGHHFQEGGMYVEGVEEEEMII